MTNHGAEATNAMARRADALGPIETNPRALITSATMLSRTADPTLLRIDGPRDRLPAAVRCVPEAELEVGGCASSSPAPERPPLIDVKEFAAKLGCCPNHIRRMSDSGRCPPSIRLGGLRRWNRQVVDDWITAGCPVVRQVRIGGRK
jgi:predicted DNA-binding transcriptional regulator AlpA